jgi:hypothetical protein
MLRQFLVGAVVSICNIAIHALMMAAVIWVAHAAIARNASPREAEVLRLGTQFHMSRFD